MTNSEVYFYRRKGLGSKSCKGIADEMEGGATVLCHNQPYEPLESGLVIRWGCTGTIKRTASATLCVLNTPDAIHRVSDKPGFRRILGDLAPNTWDDPGLLLVPNEAYPVIVRPGNHSQGKNITVCRTFNEMVAAYYQYLNHYGSAYVQKLIQKEREFRVIVVQGRVITVYEKIPDDKSEVAWNHAQGSQSKNVKWGEWNIDVVDNAISSMALSGLDFGAVDVIVDSNGRAYTLEINTGPETTSPYRQKCFAKAFNYIVKHGKDIITIHPSNDYRNYIHPAICEWAK